MTEYDVRLHENILDQLGAGTQERKIGPEQTRLMDRLFNEWFCTDCEDTFSDETGDRCPSCGFRRVIGPFKYANRHDIKEALRAGALVPNGDQL